MADASTLRAALLLRGCPRAWRCDRPAGGWLVAFMVVYVVVRHWGLLRFGVPT